MVLRPRTSSRRAAPVVDKDAQQQQQQEEAPQQKEAQAPVPAASKGTSRLTNPGKTKRSNSVVSIATTLPSRSNSVASEGEAGPVSIPPVFPGPPATVGSVPTMSSSSSLSNNHSGSGSGSKKSQTPEFLVKLHRILINEDPSIIYWDNGQIHVRNPLVLGQQVLHKYFRHSKYSSFQRQLNYFGFRKTQGKGKMSACTYTNVQITAGDIRSLLYIKRKSSTPVKGEEGGEAGLLDDEEDQSDSDGDSEIYAPSSSGTSAAAARRKRVNNNDGPSPVADQRKRVRASSSGATVISFGESLAADETLEEEDGIACDDEERHSIRSDGNTTSSMPGSGYTSSMSESHDGEEDDDIDGDEDDEEDSYEGEDSEDTFSSSESAAAIAHHVHNQHNHHNLSFTIRIPQGSQSQSSQSAQQPLQLKQEKQLGGKINGNSTSDSCSSSSNASNVKQLDMSLVPNFFSSSANVVPAPSPRGGDDIFPSCLAAFDMIDTRTDLWGWSEPPVSGSLSSLHHSTSHQALGSLDETSNHSSWSQEAHAASSSTIHDGGFPTMDLQADSDFWGNKTAAALCSH